MKGKFFATYYFSMSAQLKKLCVLGADEVVSSTTAALPVKKQSDQKISKLRYLNQHTLV